MSRVVSIRAGVPQGSVLGPTLFNIYLSDIPTNLNCDLALYADDAALIVQHQDINTAAALLQNSVRSYSEWCRKWCITLNPIKSEAKIFTLRRPNTPPEIIINGQLIQWNPSDSAVKYLGIHLDKRLTWKYHINKKIKECYMRLGLLYPLMNRNTPLRIKCSLLLYQSIIRPIITYGCPIWGTASKTLINKVQVLQNKVLRICCNAPWFVRNTQIHSELGVLTIKEFISKSAKNFFLNLNLCSSAEIFNLGAKSEHTRLKRRLPQDVLLPPSEEETDTD